MVIQTNKIDTTNWGEFRVRDLFQIHPTKAYKMTNKELLDNGRYPVVVNSSYNNGIGGTSSQIPTEYGNMITFSDTVDANTIFYQRKPFIGYAHVQGLYPIKKFKDAWSKYSLLFFVTIFRKKAIPLGFDYGNKFRRDIALDLTLKLPTINGEPNWNYMEQYMKTIEEKVEKALNELEIAKDLENKKIDVTTWGEFRVGDLFLQERGKEKAPKQNEDGNCPLIQETNINNGLDRYVKPTKIFNKNAISISINYAQNVFYQKDDFCASVNIAIIRNKNLNEYTGKFICSVLRAAHSKFNYTNKISKDIINNEIIKLPIDLNGNPNWTYMEQYMKTIENKTEKLMNDLKLLYN